MNKLNKQNKPLKRRWTWEEWAGLGFLVFVASMILCVIGFGFLFARFLWNVGSC